MKLVNIIYYILELIERLLKRKKTADKEDRIEEIRNDPQEEFLEKFERPKDMPDGADTYTNDVVVRIPKSDT